MPRLTVIVNAAMEGGWRTFESGEAACVKANRKTLPHANFATDEFEFVAQKSTPSMHNASTFR